MIQGLSMAPEGIFRYQVYVPDAAWCGELKFAFKFKAKTKTVLKSFEPNSIRCLSSDNK